MTLAELRIAAGLSKAAAARLLEVDVATIARWESGEQKPGKLKRAGIIAIYKGHAKANADKLGLLK